MNMHNMDEWHIRYEYIGPFTELAYLRRVTLGNGGSSRSLNWARHFSKLIATPSVVALHIKGNAACPKDDFVYVFWTDILKAFPSVRTLTLEDFVPDEVSSVAWYLLASGAYLPKLETLMLNWTEGSPTDGIMPKLWRRCRAFSNVMARRMLTLRIPDFLAGDREFVQLMRREQWKPPSCGD